MIEGRPRESLVQFENPIEVSIPHPEHKTTIIKTQF